MSWVKHKIQWLSKFFLIESNSYKLLKETKNIEMFHGCVFQSNLWAVVLLYAWNIFNFL